MVASVITKKLTLPASLTAATIGILVFLTAKLVGICMLLTFFLLSIIATAHKRVFKAALHSGSTHPQIRNTKQVLANGGVAGILAVFSLMDPKHIALYQIMMASSLASALADTLSSELGMVYGYRFYNILTLKRDRNGLDGVVSVEGTLLGAAGATVIALLYAGFHKTALFIASAGIIGNLVDSILGAKLERKQLIGNNVVNFLNTLFAAIIGLLFYWVFL